LQTVKTYRLNVLNGQSEASNQKTPSHTLITEYRYNTLNQVTTQKTPDAGTSNFWYDRLGRLVVSQNAKQLTQNKFSYTLYDKLGRINMVGQKPQTTAMTTAISRNQIDLDNWLNATQNKDQITRTVYDVSYYNGDDLLKPAPLVQKNLRNRVSYTQVFDVEPAGTSAAKWLGTQQAATYYSYDIHGNVDTLLQDYKAGAMNDAGNRSLYFIK